MTPLEENQPSMHSDDVVLRPPKRAIVVEPLAILYFFGVFGINLITSQYVFVRVGEKYNYTQAGVGNNDNNSVCYINRSNPGYIMQQKIESESAQFILLLNGATSGLSFFSVLYIGGYTDKRGRRFGLILPVLGSFVQSIVYAAVMCFNANIYFLLIGNIMTGCTGDLSVFFTSIFAYVADCTTHETRSRRIAAIDIILALTISVTFISLGFWITHSGFLWPTISISAVLALGICYSLFCIPETIIYAKNTEISIINIIKDGVHVFTQDKKSRRPQKLGLLLLATLFIMITYTSSGSTQTLYMLDSPLCLSTVEIGITSGVTTLCIAFGSALGVLLFFRIFKLKDTVVCLISCLSGASRYVFFGMATTRVLVYLAIPCGAFELMVLPVLRSSMSKTVSDSQQGSLFSAISCVDTLVKFAGNFIWNLIYSHTLLLYPGFVFFIMAAMIGCGAVIIGVYRCLFDDVREMVINYARLSDESLDKTTSTFYTKICPDEASPRVQ